MTQPLEVSGTVQPVNYGLRSPLNDASARCHGRAAASWRPLVREGVTVIVGFEQATEA
jgi:hypothetical protein